MSEPAVPRYRRPLVGTAGLLAVLAYLPALTAAPGRMPADSKLYLYLDPGRFLGDAASTFDPRQFAGWVPHQHVAYLWPSGPWFWWFDTIGVPDWIAHRLWIGSIMLAAGLGVRWAARELGLGVRAALTAAVVYQLSLYTLPYVSRTSVMLLPWAGLGWIIAFAVRATRRGGWGDPAGLALVVLSVGAVNATALAMIVPAPVLWLAHEGWRRSITWRAAALTAARIAVSSLGVSAWWIVMLVVQGRHGTDVLPYSESLADVSLTATSPEVWRGLGYWLFYVRDPYAATTTESLRYLSSTPAIAVSFALPVVCLAGLVWVRWTHRRFAALLVVTGCVLAVGVHPIDGRSPLMRLVAGGDDSGLALALRSSTRALPLVAVGLALAAGSLVGAIGSVEWRVSRLDPGATATAVVVVLAVVNLPALWTGAFVDPALERDEQPPAAWTEAALALDASGPDGRVLQLPGQEFGAYRWGYTVDQPLPGLTEKPLVTRDLLPLGSAGAMDLLYALDDRFQEGTFEPATLAPIARLLGVDTVWVTDDSAFDRFRTARPEVVGDLVARAPGVAPAQTFGDPFVNRPDVAMTDERAVGDPRVGTPLVPVALHEIEDAGTVLRAANRTVVVSGSGDGLVDAAASGLVDGRAVVRYSASLGSTELDAALADAERLIVTDSNRDRARHWRSSQDTTGHTEPGGPADDVLRPVSSDARLPVFDDRSVETQTIAEQRGVVRATATSYGEPFAYLPEHRAAMAVDGDPSTSWLVGEHGDPIGEILRLDATGGPIPRRLHLLQPDPAGGRRITRVVVTTDGAGGPASVAVDLDDRSIAGPGQPIDLPPTATRADVEIVAVGGGVPGTAGAVAGVGFAELGTEPVLEVVRPPHDALRAADDRTPLALVFTRLRADPMDRWRDDPEPSLVREFDLPSARTVDVTTTVRIDPRASDAELAELFGWPVIASTRLTGSLRNVGAAAFDDDPDTAWITAFDHARDARITVDGIDRAIEQLSIRQPIAGFSRITAVTVTSADESRTVELRPDAGGTATAMIQPPLPAGPVSIAVAGLEPATTVDRRHADVVELPAAVSEIVIAGAPLVDLAATVEMECVAVAALDGDPLDVTISIGGDGWLEGDPLVAQPCSSSWEWSAARHVVRGAEPAGLQLDRIVFSDDTGSRPQLPAAPSVTTIERSRTARTVDVDGCRDGCWLVLGEGYSAAWTASVEGRSLGDPVLVDGGFNGWRLPAGSDVARVDLRWTAQRPLSLALVCSLLVALVAAVVAVRDRLRRRTGPTTGHLATPSLHDPGAWGSAGDRATSGLAAAVWTVGAALLIGPSWAVWGAIAGAVVWFTRRRRLGELTGLATLAVVGVGVTVIERRDAPLPGGGWPTTFESLHGVGMFAVVCLLVGAVVADDARIGTTGDSTAGDDDETPAAASPMPTADDR